MSTHLVIVQEWEESERGWGTRPDGFSIHLNETDRKQFIADYWNTMPDEVPDTYSRPSRVTSTTVDYETYHKLENTKNGMYMPHDWRPQ